MGSPSILGWQERLDRQRSLVAGLPLGKQRTICQTETRGLLDEAYVECGASEQRRKHQSGYREYKHSSSSASAGKARNPQQRLPNELGRRRGWEEPDERAQGLPTCHSIFGTIEMPRLAPRCKRSGELIERPVHLDVG